jgi:hypothetical protein
MHKVTKGTHMFRSLSSSIYNAQPAEDLLRIPVVKTVQIRLEVEVNKRVLLLFRREVLRSSFYDLEGDDIDVSGGGCWIKNGGQCCKKGNNKSDCSEESKNVLDANTGGMHCRGGGGGVEAIRCAVLACRGALRTGGECAPCELRLLV